MFKTASLGRSGGHRTTSGKHQSFADKNLCITDILSAMALQQRCKSTENGRFPPFSTQPARRQTDPEYVNVASVKTPSVEDDNVFNYVNVAPRKTETTHAKGNKKSAFQFAKYDDAEASNYFALGVGTRDENMNIHSNGENCSPGDMPYVNVERVQLSPARIHSNGGNCSPGDSPYVNVERVQLSPAGIHSNGGSRSPYINERRDSPYANIEAAQLSPPRTNCNYADLSLTKSGLGSPGSRGSSSLNSPVKKSTSSDYIRIDTDATKAVTQAVNRSISEHRQKEGKRKIKKTKFSW